MKRVLITGRSSFVGNGVESRLREVNEERGEVCYEIERVSLRGDAWKGLDLTGVDSVVHTVGIAHADVGKVDEEGQKEYFRVNRDLAVEMAKAAKAQGVEQFIYMSSMLVYGAGGSVGTRRVISHDTVPAPENYYGESKLAAERELMKLADEEFRVAVIRAPFIYGKGCKGNYLLLEKIAARTRVFPNIRNERSMLYIENLGEFIRLLMEAGSGGVFFPQNREYGVTSELVKMIGEARGRKIALWRCLNPLVYMAALVPGKIGKMAGKAFGNLVYEQEMSRDEVSEYEVYSLEESIGRSTLPFRG
jgi:UDP-glucose 4-epimerase